MTYVYAVDIDNMEGYSDNFHCVHNEVWTDRDKLVEFLLGEGFQQVKDKWRGETVYRWSIPEEYREHIYLYEGHVPFDFNEISYFREIEATIIKLEVVEE